MRRRYGGLRLRRRRRRNLRHAGRRPGRSRHPPRRLRGGGEQPQGPERGDGGRGRLAGDDKEAERGIVLRAIDKIDRLGADGVRALLGEGRKDESGDFTKGAGLSDGAGRGRDGLYHCQARHAAPETVARLRELVGGFVRSGPRAWTSLEAIAACSPRKATAPTASSSTPVSSVASATTPARSIEAELTFEILDEKGRKRQFGSVAGGGRYDDLVKRFTGQDVPATGVSIGVDRLLAALRAKGRSAGETAGPVVVTVMDRDRMADYMAHGRRAAPGGHPGRGLPWQPEELRQPVEIRRQARSRPSRSSRAANEAAAGHRDPEGPDPGRENRRECDAGGMEGSPGSGRGAARRSGGRRPKDAGRNDPQGRRSGPRRERLLAALQCGRRGAGRGRYPAASGTLLDLYGEDIRARAYVTARPDCAAR